MLVLNSLSRQLVAEFVGTAVLVAVVVGSGIMASTLSSDMTVALLGNTFSTIFALGVLIYLFLPISGAQFNPVVTAVMWWKKEISPQTSLLYMAVQTVGAIAGAMLANYMFSLPVIEFGTKDRVDPERFVSEIVATAGLIFIILIAVHRSAAALLPVLVPAWIGSAYFFTSSTSFANPAVTIGRMFSDTFAGIAPESVPLFIVAQFIGGALGAALAIFFIGSSTRKTGTS
jgi:glycerol uptake facilitator-like aquaporin